MKKIIIGCIGLAFAISAQAATIAWNSGTIYNQANTKANAGTALVTAYLYSLTADQYAAAGSLSSAELWNAAQSGTYGAVVDTKASSALGAANINQTVTGGTSTAPATYYGVVFYTDTISVPGETYVKSAINTATFQDDGKVTLGNLAVNAASWTSASASVPEPTSGLLMLLGLAGLALKRKLA